MRLVPLRTRGPAELAFRELEHVSQFRLKLSVRKSLQVLRLPIV